MAPNILNRRSGLIAIGLAIVAAASGCDAVKGLFQPGVTIVVDNGTSFTASPDLRMSNSRNIVEDAFTQSDSITNSSSLGTVAPNQTTSLRLPCDGNLELITFKGAKFTDQSGIPFGDAGKDTAWRRDVDFDCGDTIHIRLSGSVFFFDASTSVERTSGTGGTPGAPVVVQQDQQDIGHLIDQLLGS